jgi:predicted RecB family nuclease
MQEVSMELDEMNGVTEKLAAALRGAGIDTIEALAEAGYDDLVAIPGIGPKTAESLQQTAFATLDELDRIIDSTVAEELAKAEAEEKPLFDESLFEAPAEAAAADEAGEPAQPASAGDVEISGDPFADFDTRLSELPAPEEPQERDEES